MRGVREHEEPVNGNRDGDDKVNDKQPLPTLQTALLVQRGDNRTLHDAGEQRADLCGRRELSESARIHW